MSDDQGPWNHGAPRPRRGGRLGLLLLIAAVVGLVAFLAHVFPEAEAGRRDWTDIAYAAGVVVLVAAGLLRAGRSALSERLRHLAIWAGVVAVLVLVAAYRQELASVPSHIALAFSTGKP